MNTPKTHTKEELDAIKTLKLYYQDDGRDIPSWQVFDENDAPVRFVRKAVLSVEVGLLPMVTISVMVIKEDVVKEKVDGPEVPVHVADIMDNINGLGDTWKLEEGYDFEKMESGKYIKVYKITRPVYLAQKVPSPQ